MNVTIEAGTGTGNTTDKPVSPVYPNNNTALAASPVTQLAEGVPDSGGVFPNVAFGGNKIADRHHIHEIQCNGVVYKICVTFMMGTTHVAWAFYEPDPARSSVFLRRWSPSSKRDADMQTRADAVITTYMAACKSMPAIAANARIDDWLAREASATATANATLTTAAKPEVLDVYKGANNPFGTQSAASAAAPRSKAEVDKIYETCAAKKVDILAKDKMFLDKVLTARKEKKDWPSFIKHYYDLIHAVSPLP